MKKIYLLLIAVAFAMGTQAQTLPNAGFETWRTNVAGGFVSKVVRAPISWYGADSLIIQIGQSFGHYIGINDTVWQQQVFKDSIAPHGGTYAAKLVTKDQDTLGIFPGILSNAEAHFNLATQALTYSGGTAITYRPNTVSAWVKYAAAGASDSGVLTVQVLGRYGSKPDSILGVGSIKIGPSTAYTQVTANVFYAIPDSLVDTIRVSFFSSKGGTASTVYSTLYVDDVTMTGTPFSVGELTAHGNTVAVYPNPANNLLHLDVKGNETVNCNLVSVTGQVVATKACTGSSTMDITALPAGLYFYTITDANGNTTQQGNVSIVK